MIVTQRTVRGTSGQVRIHAEEWTPRAGGTSAGRGVPIVFVPGGTGNAYTAQDLGRDAASGRVGGRPRAVLGISRRGMGLSDAPPTGYRPADFAADVEAAVSAAGYERFVLFGHSMGVPISLEHVLRYPRRVAGLVLGDTPAAYIDFKAAGTFAGLLERQFTFKTWDEAFMEWSAADPAASRDVFDRDRDRYLVEQDGVVRRLVDRDAIARTVEESVAAATDYWPRLSSISCPVLVIKGTGGDWSPLSEGDLMRYQVASPRVTTAHVPGGHQLGLQRNRSPLYDALGPLIRSVDLAEIGGVASQQ